MRKLLNLGMSDPLTLGMAHPIADRLETLGRARPMTRRSRGLAFSAMSALAIVSAPLSIASDAPENTKAETRFKFISDMAGKEFQSYEVVTEDGVSKAYRILKDGKREPAELTKNEDGTFRLTYSDGQIIDLPNLDLSGLEDLKSLKGLAGLKNLEGIEGLKALSNLEGFDFDDAQIHIFNSTDGEFLGPNFDDILKGLPKSIQEMIESRDGSNGIKIITSGENEFSFSGKGDEGFSLPDTFVFEHNDPLRAAKRQLDRTTQQLEALSDDENLSFDLQNALRDIESARKSLDAAENRLNQEK